MFKFITAIPKKLFSRRVLPKQQPYVYVALGDSTVEGIGASQPERSYASIIFTVIKERYKNAEFHNLGKGFATSTTLIETQLDKAIELQPDIVTISIGANDSRDNMSTKTFSKNLEYIIDRLKNETNAEIVLNTIPDFSLAPIIPKKLRIISKFIVFRYNNVIKKLANQERVTIVDLYEQSRIYLKTHPEAFSADGLHPSDFGYALWANTILIHIQHLFRKKRVFF